MKAMKQVFEDPATLEDLEMLVEAGVLEKLHTVFHRGYVSRKIAGIVNDYSGRFGKGYIFDAPSRKSTRYHYRTYYVFTA